MRRWPIPHPTRTLHVIGDLHITGQTETRKKILTDDVTAAATTPPRLQVGDMTVNSNEGEDEQAIWFLDGLGGDWWAIVGNHDIVGRSAADAAAAWFMPGKDFVVDLGFAVLICIGPDASNAGGMIYRTATANWLDTQLTTYADRVCLIGCHMPFYGTVGVAASDVPEKKSSFDLGYYLRGEGAIHEAPNPDGNKGEELWAVVEAHDNAKAWLSGHTHSNLQAVDLVKPVTVGGRGFAHINAGAPQGPRNSWLDPIATAYVSVLDDRLEVRFRNHGAHQWVGTGPERRRVWIIPY